jgi:Tfp pilus assembly protein PilF
LAEVSRSEAALKDALRTDPFDDAAWDVGGRIMTENGKFAEAFFDFERAIRIHPYGQYLYDYALALVRADRFDEAQTRAEMAVQADASLFEAHELLAGLHSRKKELPEAAREYEAALALKPDLSRAHLHLGIVLAAQGDRTGAAGHLRTAARSVDAGVAAEATRALGDLGIR